MTKPLKLRFLCTVGKQLPIVKNNKKLLTKWEGQTRKYLAGGHGVPSMVMSMTESQTFSRPARPTSVNQHLII